MGAQIDLAGEFDLGADAAREVTQAHFLKLFEDITTHTKRMLEPAAPVPLREAIRALPAIGEVSNLSPEKLFERVRRGYTIAMVVADRTVDAEGMLEGHGYVRAKRETSTSKHIEENWKAVLSGTLIPGECALIFGHDFDPVFVFRAS